MSREPEAAIREGKLALEIDPNSQHVQQWLGQTLVGSGQALEGVELFETLLRLGKHFATRGPAMVWLSLGYLFLGEYEKSLELAQTALS